MFDFHMHSDFSADCSIPMEKMVVTSIEKGLKVICFTDHIDYDYPDKDFIFEFDLDQYAMKIAELQEKYQGQIKINKGVEIGVQPHLSSRYEKLMQEHSFDFIICSMHTTDKKDLHFGDLFRGRTIEEAYQLYYDELLYCIKDFKEFNVLGHLDLVKRYTIGQEPDNDFHDVISAIFKEIIPAGKGIELNTSGVRSGLPSGMPSQDILKLYLESGGEIITLGSDAHFEADLGFEFQKSLKLLKTIGFKYVSSFHKQKPTFHLIEHLIK